MPRPVLLSDIGNVLVAFDFNIAAKRFAERCPYPPEALSGRLEAIKGPYESGQMDDSTFLVEAVKAMEFQGSTEEYAAIWCEIFTENPPMTRTMEELAGKLPMLLLSNTNGLHKDYMLSSFAVFRHFQDGVYSYSARCSKPEEGIFRQCIQQFDLDPGMTFYMDDLEANLVTARRLGFRTHLYDLSNHTALETDLALWRAEVGV